MRTVFTCLGCLMGGFGVFRSKKKGTRNMYDIEDLAFRDDIRISSRFMN